MRIFLCCLSALSLLTWSASAFATSPICGSSSSVTGVLLLETQEPIPSTRGEYGSEQYQLLDECLGMTPQSGCSGGLDLTWENRCEEEITVDCDGPEVLEPGATQSIWYEAFERESLSCQLTMQEQTQAIEIQLTWYNGGNTNRRGDGFEARAAGCAQSPSGAPAGLEVFALLGGLGIVLRRRRRI